jgi:hypothetical protein
LVIYNSSFVICHFLDACYNNSTVGMTGFDGEG